MSFILTTQNLSKKYGRIQALNNVSLQVPKGSVFGLLGPNGSGKTTLLSIILQVLHANEGSFSWFGKPMQAATHQQIGSLLETPNFYHYLSAVDNLRITEAISGRGDKWPIDHVLEVVKLSERKHNKFSTYSLGMKQRLAIAAALLGKPDVLVLDEPTNGLDPVGIIEIRELIKTLANEGITVIIASHLLDEIEKICSHVAILKKGNLLSSGTIEEVLVHNDMVIVGTENPTNLNTIAANLPGCIKVIDKENGKWLLHFEQGKANLANINSFFYNQGIVLNLLAPQKRSLESKFFELTNNPNA